MIRFSGDTPRIHLDPAYSDTFFFGQAAQPRLYIVKGILASALVTMLHRPVRLTMAGRADAGVHAATQMAHPDASPEAWAALPGRSQRLSEATLLTRMASVLAHGAQKSLARILHGAGDAIITGACIVSEAFDSHFDTLSRRYTYRVTDAVAPHDPVWHTTVLWLLDALDVEAMGTSARTLLGEHDLLPYYKPHEGTMIIRTLRTPQWRRIETGPNAGPESGLVALSVITDALYRSMVRSLVGVGLAAGQGRKPVT